MATRTVSPFSMTAPFLRNLSEICEKLISGKCSQPRQLVRRPLLTPFSLLLLSILIPNLSLRPLAINGSSCRSVAATPILLI